MFKIHNSISPVYLNNLIKKPTKSGLRSSFNQSFRFSVKHSFVNVLSLTLVLFYGIQEVHG